MLHGTATMEKQMKADFWHQRWKNNEIGFHEGNPNALMVKHFRALSLSPNDRVFVPLCGKTRDIAWLLSRGHRVVGAELSKLAIEQLFMELGVEPKIATSGEMLHFSAPDIDIYVGDIFDLSGNILGDVDATYDRAALVALPDDLRLRYANHVHRITGAAPQLLICFEYDQTVMSGPPFSVDAAEVARVHGARYELTRLVSAPVKSLLKGVASATETVWHLH